MQYLGVAIALAVAIWIGWKEDKKKRFKEERTYK